jgi:hypothetical protein
MELKFRKIAKGGCSVPFIGVSFIGVAIIMVLP